MTSLCINPVCQQPQNFDNVLFCQTCGSELLLEGRYRATYPLGEGGFGKTFEVQDRHGSFRVLKVLTETQPKAVELFQQEAQVLSRLHHPGIPRVEPDGYFIFFPRNGQGALHCLVMEKIEGEDLEQWMHRRGNRPISASVALDWLTAVVQILHEVHQQGIFHRDIKPSNIMLQTSGHLVLIDFGSVREVTSTYLKKLPGKQVTGIVSTGYTSPEQMQGQAMPQSDFFALGRTFVYLLTGKEPNDPTMYDGLSDEVHWRNHAPQVSPQLAEFIDALMARSANQRPANTQVILQQLVQIHRALHPSYISPALNQTTPLAQPQTGFLPAQLAAASPQQALPGWGFVFSWSLLTFGGWVIGFLIAATIHETGILHGVLSNALPVGSVASSIVIMQWLVLRHWVNWAGRWRTASLLGVLIGSLFTPTASIFGIILTIILMTFMQWRVVRQQVDGPTWLILIGVNFPILDFLTGGALMAWLLSRPKQLNFQ